jgi:hypothetical protein
MKELQSMRHVVNGTPVVLGVALVVPAGLMRKRRGEPVDRVAATFAADAAARARIERAAMDAVRRAEEVSETLVNNSPPRLNVASSRDCNRATSARPVMTD